MCASVSAGTHLYVHVCVCWHSFVCVCLCLPALICMCVSVSAGTHLYVQFIDLCILLGCDYCDSIRGKVLHIKSVIVLASMVSRDTWALPQTIFTGIDQMVMFFPSTGSSLLQAFPMLQSVQIVVGMFPDITFSI